VPLVLILDANLHWQSLTEKIILLLKHLSFYGRLRQKSNVQRVHQCSECNFEMDRDLAAALVMLLWAQGKLPGSETGLVGADATSSTSKTRKRKRTGSQKQLGQMKRQKSKSTGLDAKTQTSTK
jgi:putative transposase